jgi:MoaA/NifB/PqqE/SkfB family radical SAM enzyme
MEGVIRAWGKILNGYAPVLSIEITKECPLRCPGCYAYGEGHLGGEITLRQVHDLNGQALIDGIFEVIRRYKPLQVSFIGGEPLVRYRELNEILPIMTKEVLHTQVVTSAVREIPLAWASIPRLSIVVSIDGLQPEHDERRKPATYERILKNIAGHQVIVHCTVTRQQIIREGYLKEFLDFWSSQPAARKIWMSLYTPQIGEMSEERLTSEDRKSVVADLTALRKNYPKLYMPETVIQGYETPPESPDKCVFAKTTTCLSADLKQIITPCQFGGTPDCKNCGCMASAGFAAIARHKLPIGLSLGTIFETSFKIGALSKRIRDKLHSIDPEPLH